MLNETKSYLQAHQPFRGLVQAVAVPNPGDVPVLRHMVGKRVTFLTSPTHLEEATIKNDPYCLPEFYLSIRARSTLSPAEVSFLIHEQELKVIQQFPDTKNLHVTHRGGWHLQVDGAWMWLTSMVSAAYVH